MLNRYIDNKNGTVTDTKTGLIWLKDANCFGKQDWINATRSAAQLADGQCGLSDGSKADNWCLPTLKEWEEMVDRRYADPALSNAAGTGRWQPNDIFDRNSPDNSNDWKYWSSTPKVNCPRIIMWVMHLWEGGCLCHHGENKYLVWPLRDPTDKERKLLSDLLFKESLPPPDREKVCKE